MKEKLFKFYERYMIAMGIAGQCLFFIQGYKIFLTRSASDVSFAAFLLGLISVSSWFVYGLMRKDRALILANFFGILGALLVLVGILIHGS